LANGFGSLAIDDRRDGSMSSRSSSLLHSQQQPQHHSHMRDQPHDRVQHHNNRPMASLGGLGIGFGGPSSSSSMPTSTSIPMNGRGDVYSQHPNHSSGIRVPSSSPSSSSTVGMSSSSMIAAAALAASQSSTPSSSSSSSSSTSSSGARRRPVGTSLSANAVPFTPPPSLLASVQASAAAHAAHATAHPTSASPWPGNVTTPAALMSGPAFAAAATGLAALLGEPLPLSHSSGSGGVGGGGSTSSQQSDMSLMARQSSSTNAMTMNNGHNSGMSHRGGRHVPSGHGHDRHDRSHAHHHPHPHTHGHAHPHDRHAGGHHGHGHHNTGVSSAKLIAAGIPPIVLTAPNLVASVPSSSPSSSSRHPIHGAAPTGGSHAHSHHGGGTGGHSLLSSSSSSSSSGGIVATDAASLLSNWAAQRPLQVGCRQLSGMFAQLSRLAIPLGGPSTLPHWHELVSAIIAQQHHFGAEDVAIMMQALAKLRSHAASIRAIAAANGTPLPPIHDSINDDETRLMTTVLLLLTPVRCKAMTPLGNDMIALPCLTFLTE
jgi:hypothetical protein